MINEKEFFMRFIKLAFLSILAGVLFTACAAPRYYIDAEWKSMPKATTAKVVFAKPTVANPDDLKDDLPEYVDNFAKWFGPQVKEYLNAESRNQIKFSMKQVQPGDISYTKQKLGKEDFDTPAFANMEDNVDLYIVVSDIWLGRDTEVHHYEAGTVQARSMDPLGMNPMGGSYSTNVFISKCKYAFYDAKTKKLLGYGHAEGSMGYSFAVTKGDWEGAVRSMVVNLAWNTPIVSW